MNGITWFAATRPHIEVYVRWLGEDGRLAPATVARRLSTVIGFYRFMVIDGRLEKSPAEYVRRPRVSTESQALGLDRMQLGGLVAAARASGPMDAALITVLGLLGLRVSEACSIDLEDFGAERGHCTVHIVGKSGKPALIPLPPPVARTLDLAAGERGAGPRLLTRSGRGWTATPPPGPSTASPSAPASNTKSAATPSATPTSPQPGRRRPAARRADRSQTRRPAHHHPV